MQREGGREGGREGRREGGKEREGGRGSCCSASRSVELERLELLRFLSLLVLDLLPLFVCLVGRIGSGSRACRRQR